VAHGADAHAYGAVVVVVVVPDDMLHTVIVAVAGKVTWVPPAGLWSTTVPSSDGSQAAVVVVWTVRPWPVSAELALAELSPTTFWTTTWQGPEEIVRLTAVPRPTEAPDGGVEAET
jgi:hypothetical protein